MGFINTTNRPSFPNLHPPFHLLCEPRQCRCSPGFPPRFSPSVPLIGPLQAHSHWVKPLTWGVQPDTKVVLRMIPYRSKLRKVIHSCKYCIVKGKKNTLDKISHDMVRLVMVFKEDVIGKIHMVYQIDTYIIHIYIHTWYIIKWQKALRCKFSSKAEVWPYISFF